MKRTFFLLFPSFLLLAACVDTTGLSPQSLKPPHPRSNLNAIVTVTDYSDLQCPACRAAHVLIVPQLLEKYGQQIRLEFRQFPLATIHRFALPAAEASECAADQGKFWEFVDLNYAEQDQLSEKALAEWGNRLGLDQDLFSRCRRSHIKRDAILAEYEEGKTKGVRGTPTFFVNGQPVVSTIEDLSKAIDEALAAAARNL